MADFQVGTNVTSGSAEATQIGQDHRNDHGVQVDGRVQSVERTFGQCAFAARTSRAGALAGQ